MTDYTQNGLDGQQENAVGIESQANLRPSISIKVGSERREVDAGDLIEEEYLKAQITQVEGGAHIQVDRWEKILDLPSDIQAAVLDLVEPATGRCVFGVSNNATEFSDPFAATMAVNISGLVLGRIAAATETAIHMAARFFPGAEAAAAGQFKNWLKTGGHACDRVSTIARKIRDSATQSNANASETPTAAANAFLGKLQQDREQRGEQRDGPPLWYYRDEFFLWTGKTWQKLSDGEVELLVTRALHNANTDREITSSFVRDVILNVKSLVHLDARTKSMPFYVDAVDPLQVSHPLLTAFDNGIVDIQPNLVSGTLPQLQRHDPRYFSVVTLPFQYDPEATHEHWVRTLGEIFPPTGDDDHRIEVLQEYVGLTLLAGYTSLEKALVLTGCGANGKSTILRVWERLLGRENVSHIGLDAISGEFRLEQLDGKLANIAFDMPRIDRTNEGRLKELISGEPMQVNRKYKDVITIRPSARLIFATNILPQISDRSDGMWRRLIIIPFLERVRRRPRGFESIE